MMIGSAYVGPMGEYLSINLGKDWHIMIRRRDSEPCNCFQQFKGRRITSQDVQQFLPNWDSLDWQPTCLGYSRGVTSEDGEFQVRLLTAEDPTLPDEQIVAEFREVMGNAVNHPLR